MPDRNGYQTLRDRFPITCDVCKQRIEPARYRDGGTGILKRAGVLGEQGMSAPTYAAAVSALSRYMAVSKAYVRTADGDFAQV